MRSTSGRRALGVLSAAVLVVSYSATAAFGSTASAGSDRVRLSGLQPGWARSAHVVGAPAASRVITFDVALALRRSGDAERLLRSVSSPKSASYGAYLSSREFDLAFAPTIAAVGRVRNFLAGQGFRVGDVAAGNRWVSATGTVAQIDHAFAIRLRTYRVNGQARTAPDAALSMPRSVAADVLAVTGLATSRVHPTVVKPDEATIATSSAPVATAPCSSYWNQHQQTMPAAYGRTSFPTYICGYSPAQLRAAYDVKAPVLHGTNGRGVTVAIVDAYDSPTILADANQYAVTEGDAPFVPGQFIDTSTPSQFDDQDGCGGEEDWNEEQTLDVEAVHGMAPGATVHYFGANDCDSAINDTLNTIVQTHAASIVSNSYSYGTEEIDPAEVQLEHSFFLQAGLEGIGFYFSSGDDGDNSAVDGVNAPEPGYQSSDPLVTAVGGTSLAIGATNGYQFETGWSESRDFVDYSGPVATYEEALPGDFYAGAGGGVSTLFAEPWYQKGTVAKSLATSRGGPAMRTVPDVSADADPYAGFAFGKTTDGVFSISNVGGTSLACPLIAGIQADASTRRRLPIGFANPLLYAVGRVTLRDVTPPSTLIAVSRKDASALVTFTPDTSLTVTRGYDDVTGMGTPRGQLLLLAEGILP